MKPEKMTDEMVEATLTALRRANAGSTAHCDRVNRVAAHVAALSAEVDEFRESRDMERDLANVVARERDALRERVQALKEQVRDVGARLDRAEPYALILESRLAAIRQWAGDLRALTLRDVMTGEWNKQAASFVAFVLGDDAPAPVSEALHCCGTTTEKHRSECPTAKALAPLGMAPPVSELDGLCEPSTVKGGHKLGTNSKPTMGASVIGTPCACSGTPGPHEAGAPCIADECTTCEGSGRITGGGQRAMFGTVETCAACGGTGATPEPTTAEAFAECASARAALTDAPPVFTLEEVDRALAEAQSEDGESFLAVAEGVRKRLAALRKVTP